MNDYGYSFLISIVVQTITYEVKIMAKNKKAIKTFAAAALVTSALVPVASASASTTYSDVVVTVNGELVTISQAEYNLASALGKAPSLNYLKVDGKYYAKSSYDLQVALGKADPFQALVSDATASNITPKTGSVDGSGNVVTTPVTGELKVESVSAINSTGTSTNLEGATVSRNTTYSVKFSENLDKSTVSNTTFKVLKDGVQVAISSPILNLNTVTFSALATLDANANYTLVIEGVKSDKGAEVAKKTVAFKTATETVVRTVTVTGGGATGNLYNPNSTTAQANIVGTWANATNRLTIELDEAIDASTLNSSTVKLVDVKTGKALAVEATLQTTRNFIDVQVVGTTDFLMPKNQYKLVLDGVKAANGNIVEAFAFDFAYQQPGPVVQNPGVYLGATNTVAGKTQATKVNPSTSSTLLGDKSTFKEGAKLSVDFGASNARLDESTITTNYFKLVNVDTEKEVAVTLNYVKDTNRVELVPTKNLEDNTEYRVEVSQHVKNVNGLSIGKKDADAFKSTTFETYDITTPEVKDVKVVGGDINNLKVGETATVEVTFSERVASPTVNSAAYTDFVAGNGNGAIGIFRADNNAAVPTALTIGAPSLSADGKTVKFNVTVNDDTIAGYAYKVVLAGYNPVRGNSSAKAIVDSTTNTAYVNAMANDYTFNFTVEGEDTVAPKVSGAKAQQGSNTYVDLQGATNVKGNVQITLDDKVANIHGTNKGKVEFYQNGSLVVGSAVTLTVGNYSEVGNQAVITVPVPVALPAGATEVRVSEIQDKSGNESSTYRTNFVAGKGESVATTKFVTLDAGASLTADNASIEIEFSGDMDNATLTSSNIKVYDGETEVTGSLDLKDISANIVYFKPSTKFTAGKAYKVVVAKDVKDAKGNHLQPVATEAPKAYDVTISAPTTGDIQSVGNGVYDEAARTVTFEFTQKVDAASTTFSVEEKATGTLVSTTRSTVKVDDKKVIITLNDEFAKDTEYVLSYTAKQDGSAKTAAAAATFTPSKKLVADTTPGAPKLTSVMGNTVAENVTDGTTVTAKTTMNVEGQFTLTFSEAVKLSEVIDNLAVYNITTAKDIKLLASSITATTAAGYTSTITVDLPGTIDASNEVVLTIAKEKFTDIAGFKNAKAIEVVLKTP